MKTSAAAIAAELKDPNKPPAILSGFPTIDNLLGGFVAGRMYLLMARTEVGKTTLALNFAAAPMMRYPAVSTQAETAVVGIASLEMTRHEVLVRTLSILTGQAPDDVEASLAVNGPDPISSEWLPRLQNFHIWDEPGAEWSHLGQWVDDVYNSTGEKMKLLVLDHLMLLGGYKYAKGPTDKIQQAAKDAKIFAKDKNLALILIHQTHRMAGENLVDHGDQPVTLESGQYGGEQDADVALGAYRPERNPYLTPAKKQELKDKMFVQILKNRHGRSLPEGIECHWRKPSMRIEEV